MGIGRFTFHDREYLAAVRSLDGVLALHTMRFRDEVRPSDEMAPGGRKPARKKIEQAAAVIESLATEWDPERYTDCYRERLKRVVKQKQKGEKVKAPSEPKQPKPAPDLMEALRATLERMGDGRGRKSDGRSRQRAKAGSS